MKGTFATAINCIDGRVQKPVAEWMKEHCNVDYIDVITEPGADKALLDGKKSVKRSVSISINAHNSNAVAIAGHHDCAANPCLREEHLEQISKCAEIIKGWQLQVRVLGLWVNENWKIELVCDSEA